MGAFLAGMLGAAGRDAEKQEQRQYDEAKAERAQKLHLVELAGETAISKGLYNELPAIFGELDELGIQPSNSPKGVKDPFRQMGGALGKLLSRRKQQLQQQGQQQQDQQDVQGAPGVTAQPPVQPQAQQPMAQQPMAQPSQPMAQPAAAQPQPPAQPPAQAQPQLPQLPQLPTQSPNPPVSRGTPPMPRSVWERMGPEIEQQAERERLAKLDTFAKEQSIKESLDVGTESRHYRQIQDRVAQLKKNPDTKDLAIEDIYAIASGKPPTSGGKTMKGDIMPDTESSTGFSRIMMNHKGEIVGRESGILPPAGWAPQSSTTYRFVPQADGTFKAVQVTSTHTRQIPGLPPTSLRNKPVGGGTMGGGGGVNQGGGGGGTASVAAPGAIVGQKPPGEGEMAIAHGAQGAMESAARMAKELNELPQKHPWLTGQFRGRIADIGANMNAIPGDMRQILADKDSVAAFTMGIHRARGRGYADKWAEVIGDPFVNPGATRDVVLRIGKIAEAVQKRILSANRYKPTTMEDIERQMDKEGAFAMFDQPPPTGTTAGPPPTRLNPYR